MKRYIGLIVLLLLFAFGFDAVAHELDLSQYTQEELIELRSRIDEELKAQGYYGIIYPGKYVVGIDIKANRYTFMMPTGCEDKDSAWVSVYENAEKDEANDRSGGLLTVIDNNHFYSFALKDGMILRIRDHELCLSVDKPSWAP